MNFTFKKWFKMLVNSFHPTGYTPSRAPPHISTHWLRCGLCHGLYPSKTINIFQNFVSTNVPIFNAKQQLKWKSHIKFVFFLSLIILSFLLLFNCFFLLFAQLLISDRDKCVLSHTFLLSYVSRSWSCSSQCQFESKNTTNKYKNKRKINNTKISKTR